MPKINIALGAILGLLVFIIATSGDNAIEGDETFALNSQETGVSSIKANDSEEEVPLKAHQTEKEDLPAQEDLHVSVQINQAIQSYDELSQYPPYSQPIRSKEHLNSFVNTVYPDSSLPFPFEGVEQPIDSSVALNEYNYFYGDTISARIDLTNIPLGASVEARAQIISLTGEVLANIEAEVVVDDSQHKAFISGFDTKDYDASQWPLELNFAVLADVDGNKIFLTAPFRLNSATAELSSLGYSEVEGAHLRIPVNMNVLLSGYYFVSGVLYSGESEQPLVYLETEGRLGEGSQNLFLKAHVQALKQGGDEGPYELRNIKIERWSDEVIPMDVAGKVTGDDFVVEGYRFDDFEDSPYVDPLKQERMRLMQGLSAL